MSMWSQEKYSKDLGMNEKLKAVLAVCGFLVAAALVSLIVFWPYQKVWSSENEYDTLFLGASRTYKGIEPLIIDRELNCNSYLLASDSCSLEDRYYLLESALEQKSLKRVIIEISFDAFADYWEDNYVYEVEPMSKLEGIGRKIRFSYGRFDFWQDEYDNVYPALMSYGVERWICNMQGKAEEKGFVRSETASQVTPDDRIAADYNADRINTNYVEEKISWAEKTIELALENNLEVILINTPDTETKLWRFTGWEVYQECLEGIAEKYGVEFYDFNLYIGREDILNDDLHFFDENHLSGDGADVFTNVLVQVIRDRDSGKSVDDMFYASYEEAKENLTYAEYMEQ